MPPRHWVDPCAIGPRFMSLELIGQAFPPKDKVMVTWVEHAKNVFVSVSVLTSVAGGTNGRRKSPAYLLRDSSRGQPPRWC